MDPNVTRQTIIAALSLAIGGGAATAAGSLGDSRPSSLVPADRQLLQEVRDDVKSLRDANNQTTLAIQQNTWRLTVVEKRLDAAEKKRGRR